jgi:serine O-acetyltransferase
MDMGPVIKCDLHRKCGRHDMPYLILSVKKDPAFRYVYLMRKTSAYHKRHPVGMLWRVFLKRCSARYGMQISPETRIGKGFLLLHWGPMVISHIAVIGDYCTLSQGVTIGVSPRGDKSGAPVLGNRVWVGPNAVLVGGIKIGDNVLIGPCAYVNFDVPDNSIVIGNPGKVVESDSATEGYIENMLLLS